MSEFGKVNGALDQFSNSQVKKMAQSLIVQADDIRDEDADASLRRTHLVRAASHLFNAFAELKSLQDVRRAAF